MPALKRKKTSTNEFRELLNSKRNELQARIEQRRREILAERDPDDEGAQALQSVTSDLAVTNMEREIRTLAEIELSLRRIEAGEYGVCGGCGEQIPEARLHALPWTRLCVACAGGAQSRIAPRNEEREETEKKERSAPAVRRPFLVRTGGSKRRA